ncbi:MAG: glycosyltransferase family 2 protein, partial [bacterium]
LYWKYETLLKKLSGRLGTLPGGAGAIFALRLDAYEPLTEFRGDDFELPVMAIIKGFRSVFIEDALSFEPPSPDLLTEFRRKKRIVGIMVPSGFALFGKALMRGRFLLAFQLLSHKILRWLVPFFMIALLLCSILLWNAGIFWRIAFLVQVIFYILAISGWAYENVGKAPPKVFRLPFYFTMVNVAGLMGFLRAIGGKPIKWERNR